MNKYFLTAFLIPLLFVSGGAYAEKQPQTDQEKFSYAVGVQLAQNVFHQQLKIDNESFLQGISDMLNRKELKVSMEEMKRVMSYLMQRRCTQALTVKKK